MILTRSLSTCFAATPLKRCLGIAAVLMFATGGSNAFADVAVGGPASLDPFTINFDENGVGTASSNGGPFLPSPGILSPDASNGGSLALMYVLPDIVGNGTVRVWEDFVNGTLSDAIRFTDANGSITGGTADRMFYYSQAGGGDLADTGFPANILAGNFANIFENANGTFTFTAAGPNIYNGVSSPAIPEPGTMTLALFGLALGHVLTRRSKPTG